MPPVLSRRRPAVILGVCPARDGDRAWHPDAASGQRLAELACVEPERLSARFALDNLVPYAAPSRKALKEAAALYRFVPGFWYVLCGEDVVRALGRRARPAVLPGELPTMFDQRPRPLCWYESREGVVMASMPHPSGRNRLYNDVRLKHAAGEFLRDVAWRRAGERAHDRWVRARDRVTANIGRGVGLATVERESA